MKTFKDVVNQIGIYDFMDDSDWTKVIGAEMVEDNSDINHDSYGNEDSFIEKIFYHQPTDSYWRITGERQSYSGTEYHEIEQVKPKQVQKYTYEKIDS